MKASEDAGWLGGGGAVSGFPTIGELVHGS